MNVLVLSELAPAQLSDVGALLARCERADHHPALAEPQRLAAAQPDLGGHGALMIMDYEGDALVGAAMLTPAGGGDGGVTALHVAVDPQHRQQGTVRSLLIRTSLEHAGGKVRLWVMQATAEDDADADRLGFTPERDLPQMRVPLPLPAEIVATARPVATRAFQPGRDDEAWLSVNNRAFAGHPEQGGWTLDDLRMRMKADWFDPEGFLVADAPDGDGLIGSCWTKVHRHSVPVLGEIYVVSVDPARHSEGWGRALTVAGLQWMTEQGVPVGMLYADANNTTAIELYKSLGFTVDHVDRSYLGSAGGGA